jgi:hypothetical protein
LENGIHLNPYFKKEAAMAKRRITLIWRENGKFKSKECELDEGEVLHVVDAIDKDDPNHDIYMIT